MNTKQTVNGMYALLVVVAAFLSTGIYFACSADDDFASNYEMETFANHSLQMRLEPGGGGNEPGETLEVNEGSGSHTQKIDISDNFTANVTISWSKGLALTTTLTSEKSISDSVVYTSWGDTLYYCINYGFPNYNYIRIVEKDNSAPNGVRVIYKKQLTVTYQIYHYSHQHELDYVETITNKPLTFSVDASSSAFINYPSKLQEKE